MKKTERIEIRISLEEKIFLAKYCQKTKQTISLLFRNFIKQLQEEDENNAKKN